MANGILGRFQRVSKALLLLPASPTEMERGMGQKGQVGQMDSKSGHQFDWVLSIQSSSRLESGGKEKLHFCDLISKAIHLKLAKMLWDQICRPRTSTECSECTEEGRLLSKPAFHPSSQPLLLFLAGSQQLLAGSEQLSTNVASVALQK